MRNELLWKRVAEYSKSKEPHGMGSKGGAERRVAKIRKGRAWP